MREWINDYANLIERSTQTWTIKDLERLTLAEPVEANVSRKTVNTGLCNTRLIALSEIFTIQRVTFNLCTFCVSTVISTSKCTHQPSRYEKPRTLSRTGAAEHDAIPDGTPILFILPGSRRAEQRTSRQASWLPADNCRLQLRHSAGLAPASTFTPWHPGPAGHRDGCCIEQVQPHAI